MSTLDKDLTAEVQVAVKRLEEYWTTDFEVSGTGKRKVIIEVPNRLNI